MLEGHPFRDAPVARPLARTQIKPKASRWGKFLGISAVAAIWNVAVPLAFVGAWKANETFFVVFTGVFVLIGIGILLAAIHAFLALFNPTVELSASDARPALGDTLEVTWRLTGKVRRVRQLEIHLEGIEEAKYTRGTTTSTDSHTFARFAVVATRSPDEIAEGTATVLIPRDTMPTWSASNNKIVWRLVVAGGIPNWPDIDDEFGIELTARPRDRAKAAA